VLSQLAADLEIDIEGATGTPGQPLGIEQHPPP
jgi:hypothetical protein